MFILAMALAATGSAHAQSAASTLAVPKPAKFYFDADAQAPKPVIAVGETGGAAVATRLKFIDRDPRAKAGHAQQAHWRWPATVAISVASFTGAPCCASAPRTRCGGR